MPSEPSPLDRAMASLRPRRAAYQESVLGTASELEAKLRDAKATSGSGITTLGATLGPLGMAQLDLSRLAQVLAPPDPGGDEAVLDLLEKSAAILKELWEADPGPLVLPEGGNLAAAVGDELARLGIAFGVARAVRLAQASPHQPGRDEAWFHAYPFSNWNAAERRLAPPVVVSLSGADLKPGGLAEFLDGNVKLALVVRDQAAPIAPLVRLITPGVFVAQTHDGAQLARLAEGDGPGVVAWLPESSAAFVHDPAAGPALEARLRVLALPPASRRRLGGLSGFQLAEERNQLEALLPSAGPEVGPPAAGSADPVDRLAGWILQQSGINGPIAEPGS